jgi:opine dehydrogenase
LVGAIEGDGVLHCVSTDLKKVIEGAEVIMVTTIANAHSTLAEQMAPILQENQVVVLNPGRTGGALEFLQTIKKNGCINNVYVAEAQTLVYACRIVEDGVVNVIGVKDKVLISSVNSKRTQYVLDKVKPLYPCFEAAENVLRTSLENIGAIFHPCVLLFNAATIERQSDFWFYRDMTPAIADFIEAFDRERLAVGNAYGINLLSVREWISYAYPETKGETLCEKMVNNPSYYAIKSPSTIFTRQLTEDIPTGVLPIVELGKVAGVDVSLMESMINICSTLLQIDFRRNGRTLKHLGLANMTKEEILKHLS